MTATHETGTIDELCDVEYGTRVVRKRDAGSTYPVYGGGGETFYLDSFNRENRVVIARFAMSEKCTRKVLGKFALNDSGLTLSPKNTESLRQDYLDYWILNLNDVIYEKARGTAQKNLDMSAFREIELSFPRSIEKQKLVVEKLDKAFAEIDSLEKNLQLKEEKTNQLLQSMLSAALSNTNEGDIKVVRLGEICAFSRGLTYKKSDEVGFSKNIVLRANNIDLSTNSLLLDDLRYIKDSIKIESEKLVKKNSLIICTASGSKSHLGKVALITEDFGYSFGGFMGQITPSKDCHHRFLFYIFTSPSFKDFLMGLTDGTNINNLKFTDIENYEVQLPKYEDQVKIVMKLDTAFAEIDKLKIQISIQKEQISSLRQSILSNAFKFEEKVA